jgi:trans-aconitate methyltransferase
MAGQDWSAEQYTTHASFVPELGAPLVEWLTPRPGERVLDLGCGDGKLTEKLVDAGCRVVAVDASVDMIGAARERGLDACVAQGQALPFDGEFDAVFSNAALHWMPDADAVIAAVWRALKPGGRFVAEMGGRGNVAVIVSALESGLRSRGFDPSPYNPWYFPDAAEYTARLTAQGLAVDASTLFSRPTPLPGDIDAWLKTFAESFTNALPAGEHDAFISEVRAAAAPSLRDGDGKWTADYVRLRFRAFKPANSGR